MRLFQVLNDKQKYHIADPVENRLVQKINQQAVSADEAEHGDIRAKELRLAASLDHFPQEEARKKQEDPRQQRKVVGGMEISRFQPEEGQIFEPVQRIGQGKKPESEKSQESLRQAVEKRKQHQRADGSPNRRYFLKKRLQRRGNEHRASDQVENAEPDRLGRHREHRDHRDGKTAEVDDDASLVRMLRKVHRDTGDEDKGTADEPFPYDGAGRQIPAYMYSEHLKDIVAQVVGDHIEHGNAADHIYQVVSSG